MFKIIIFGLLVLITAGVSGAESRKESQKQSPNLSGTWKRDNSKGKPSYDTLSKHKMNLTLVISHAEPEIKITYKLSWADQERVRERTYYTDGRGETNQALSDNPLREIRTTTAWKGDKLIVTLMIKNRKKEGTLLTGDTFEEWKLSSDGKTLTQIMKQYYAGYPPSVMPARPQEVFKNVFIRFP